MNKKIRCGHPVNRGALLAAGLIGLAFLTGCQKDSGNTVNQNESDGSGTETVITGSKQGFAVAGSGAKASENVVTISDPGTYRFNGTVEDGRVVIDAGTEDEVTVILDGFSIASSDFSPIYGKQCGLLTVVLEDGTENTVSDGSSYSYSTAGEDEPNAAIFSKDDLVLEGGGTLTVNGNYQEGIRGKDDLTIQSGNYVINSVNDGIKGKDSVEIADGTFAITSGGDGIQASNDTDEGKGYVKISGGNFTVNAGEKGIKAETLVEIAGGDIAVESVDDAVHSNKDVKISSGTLALSTGDDAIHGDNQVEISGGTIDITKSYEGLEGLCIDITGGEIKVVSDDDGLNAAGGNDSSGNAGKMGDDPFASTEGAYIRITGGSLSVKAMGDGIDSNRDLFIEGGSIYVEGPESSGNGILDFNGTGTITGGTFTGVGNAGMFQVFSETSSQPVMVKYYEEKQAAGTAVEVLDDSGTQLATVTPDKEFSVLIFSSPDLKTGKTYQIRTGEDTTEIQVTGIVNQSGEALEQDRGGIRGGNGAGGRQGRPGELPEGDFKPEGESRGARPDRPAGAPSENNTNQEE